MDNLTHAMAGVLLSRAGFNRITPQAGWLMLVSANLPDLDIVAGLVDSVTYLDWHRGWTHALAWSPFVALVPLALWWLLTRKQAPDRRQWVGAFLASLAGVWSHIGLDWLTVYGTRWKLPFSGEWLRLDLLYIVDVWVWAMFLTGLAAPALGKLVSQEIGARTAGRTGRGSAWVTLVVFSLYLGTRALLHEQAVAILEARMHQGRNARRTAAMPTAFLPWRWVGLAETNEFYRVYDLDLLKEFDPEGGRTIYKAREDEPALLAARQSRTAQMFMQFSQFPLWQTTPAPDEAGATVVTATDLRFGVPEEERFQAKIRVDPKGQVTDEAFAFGSVSPR